MSGLLSKLLARIGFFTVLALILPLAIQNRQLVEIYLNPFSLFSASEPALTLPLFMALLLALALGVFIGYGLGRLAGRSKAAKQADKTADLLARMTPKAAAEAPAMTGEKNAPVAATSMLKAEPSEAAPKASGSAAARAALRATRD
ncbi:MAG: hypothetical protein ACON4V_01910 [Parvibaculales bacterium]